jgi:PAS domain S-box-containing protein
MDELRYRMLADFVPHVVWTARPDGYRDYFNRRWYELTGLSLERSLGWGWVDAVEPTERAATVEHWAQSTRSGQDYEREVRLRAAPGVYRWHVVRAVPVKDRSERVLKWFGTCTDIEEQKIARDEAMNGRQKIEEMARELGRSNEALTQFASVASHDLQEPLHKISSYADLLASADSFGDREKKFLDHIQTATHRMNRLIKDVLAYAKVSASPAHREDVPLKPLVQQVLEDLDTRVREKEAQIFVDELPVVPANHSQMRQLFQNIISNALKYSKPTERPRIEIICRELGENVEIVFQDNGIGFDNAAREKIFHPFERLHGRSEYDGSGLGLAVCRRIAETHGGTITAESEPGVGSTFRVVLPIRRRN